MPDFLIRKDSGELELVTGTEPFVVSPGAGPGSYDVYRLDNSASVILQGSGDAQAPSLASLSAVVANNQATLNWSTDEANGTTYWVCTDAVTVPSTSQIIAGQDHTGAPAEASGAQPVTAAGAQSTAPVDGLQNGQTYSFHLMQRDAAGNASGTLTSTVTVPAPAARPVLSGLTVTGSGTTASLSYATSVGSGGMYWVLTASATAPESWRIKRAEDHAGNPALASGSQRPSTAGVQPLIVVNGLAAGGTYHFHMYHRANNETSLVASASVTLENQVPTDTTAPVLSGVSASLAGATATLRWSSNEGNGTGHWVCTTSATAPTATRIIAGQDHTGAAAIASGAQAVSTTGSQADQTVPGLSAGSTYFFHLLHRDANGNTSTRYSTAGVTVASSGVSAEIGIVHRSVTQTAPEALVFDLSLAGFDTPSAAPGQVYNPQLHDLYYYWDFGDSYTFQAPEKLIPQYRNSGIAYGPKVSHTYRQPGVYNVSCLIVEPSSGKSVTASMPVTVGNPETLYAGTRTIFVDTTGAGTGAPSGALVFTRLEDAFSEVYTGSSNVPRRIMLRRGQTFVPSYMPIMGSTNNRMNSLICAGPGTGAKPVVDTRNAPMGWGNANGATIDCDLKIQNVVFEGPWDVTTQSGSRQEWLPVYENRPKQLLVDGCEFSGYNIVIIPIFTPIVSPDPYIIINDSSMTDYRSACLFGSANWVGTGNKMAQNPDALVGYSGSGNDILSCVRFPAAETVIWTQNDMFGRTGWFPSANGSYDGQGCFRGNTAGLRGAFYNVNTNAMEGGFGVLGFDLSDNPTSYPINAIVDKNIFVGDHGTNRVVGFAFGGITFRNNVGIIPDTQRYGPGLGEFYRQFVGGNDAENAAAPVKVYNNTFVCSVNTATSPGGPIAVSNIESVYSNAAVENNLNLQPNRGGVGLANIDTTVLWSPRYTHYQDDNTPRDTSVGTPGNAISLYGPLPGSPALGDALNGTVAYDDFLGNARPQLPSRGASEVS